MTLGELLQRIYADPPLVFQHLHPDFRCHAAGLGPTAGTFVGAEAFAAHLAELQALSQGSFQMGPPESVVADETWAMVVTRITGNRNGRALALNGFGVWRMQDGKLAEHWESVSDPKAWEAFWS